MAAPWRTVQNQVEWGSAKHRVFDASVDLLEAEVFDTTNQVPISVRNHPVVGARWTKFSFKALLCGSGTPLGVAPPLGPIFKMCGLKETVSASTSVTYAQTGDLATDTTPLDIDFAIGNGYKIPLANCVGDCSFEIAAGAPVVVSVNGVGIYTAPTEAALASSIEVAANPVAAVGLTVSMAGAAALVLKRVGIALNNETNSPNLSIVATDGCDDPDLVDQKPSFGFLCEVPALSVLNFPTRFTGGTSTALAIALGTVSGNICNMAATGYPMAAPAFSDVNGILAVTNSYRVGWEAGDTKFQMVFT